MSSPARRRLPKGLCGLGKQRAGAATQLHQRVSKHDRIECNRLLTRSRDRETRACERIRATEDARGRLSRRMLRRDRPRRWRRREDGGNGLRGGSAGWRSLIPYQVSNALRDLRLRDHLRSTRAHRGWDQSLWQFAWYLLATEFPLNKMHRHGEAFTRKTPVIVEICKVPECKM